MTNHPRYQNTPLEHSFEPGTAFAYEPCQITHAPATQLPMYTRRRRRI